MENDIQNDWKNKLTPESYHILREKGTEPAFTGAYYKTKDSGMYVCVACGNEVFSSDTKYDSGSGWPSFYAPHSKDAVVKETDTNHGMERIEITCARCGGHLSHVFPDGPKPTGERYCINSAALKLKKN